MKKALSVLSVFGFIALLSTIGHAQHLYFGTRVGANLANQSSNPLPDGATNKLNSGLLAGAEFDYRFDSMWSLEMQGLYDQKGTNEHYTSSSTELGTPITMNGAVEANFYYFEVPLLVKASFGTGGLQSYLFAGPSFGFFLSGNESDQSFGTSNGVSQSVLKYSTVSNSTVNSPDISLIGGGGISHSFSSGQLIYLDAAYAFGLTNIAHTQSGDNTTIKSRDIRLAAGILFPLD